MCDSNAVQKWVCEYCTYENFPQSLKCTMCKGLKPLLNEDIFRLSPPQPKIQQNYSGLVEASSLSLSQTNINACGQSTNPDAMKNKWSCPSCTYLNWPRSQRCVQCNTRRPPITSIQNSNSDETVNNIENVNLTMTSSSTLQTVSNTITTTTISKQQQNYQQENQISSKICQSDELSLSPKNISSTNKNGHYTNIHEQLKNLNISENNVGSDPDLVASNNLNLASSNKYSISSQMNSPIGSITNLASSRNTSNLPPSIGAVSNRISPVETRTYTNKWACTMCTYENWPKSLKCSMCGHSKENNSDINERCNFLNNRFPVENEENNDSIGRNTMSNNTVNNKHRYQLGSSETINNCDNIQERQERRQRQIRRQVDWQWLNACLGVVENNYSAVEAYLSCGGNPARSLTSNEIAILNRNSAFDVGHTLIHLAIRFHREEMLPMLLAQISGGPGIKRVPSFIAPDLASDIRRHFANSLRIRKSPFNCHYVHEHATFALPADIEELPIPIQEQLYDELLDRDAQKQLENPPPALNWSLEITARLGSRLLVLWNRSAGDCLLDSAMQATWGVFDRDNVLRRALADSLHQCGHIFYPRWKEYEMFQAAILHFTLEETQWEEDWASLLSLASQPGSSLEQLHIFALAHILRRPIIVYGVKYVKSFRGEDIGYARFEGLYLPLLWEQSFCIKSPIALGYTRGHFSALVPMEPYARIEASRDEPEDVTFLPLMDCEMKLLPIHFLTQSEMGREETIMRQWLDVCCTEGGILVAQQTLRKRPLLVAQMLEEWLNHYRRIAQVIAAPFGRRPITGYSSDGDSDEE
ncbi:ubiquitin thioesterase trabid isoform X2 [Condylostylus longicornis]|uniref:ubiquitin thioesterase trabid isoform X2 n=1 Tax=Condylostylus longicornis TaxID=2530218 RepID=UPI00244E3D7A|nr:ubiquitin thioesterase trabid isoform X2 [Condylostylus longicornis]